MSLILIPCTPSTFLVIHKKEYSGQETGVLGYVGCYVSYCQITHWLCDLYTSVSCEFSQCESSNTSD